MNPLRLELENFRRYRHLDLDIPDGRIVIVGRNGAGKSSLLQAIETALYGARSLAGDVTHGAKSMAITLTFEHRGETYRVRRGWKSGKATLDLERAVVLIGDRIPTQDSSWEPLTRENAKATQEHIEQLLGLSRDTLRASSLLMQGDAAAFTAATPARRKEFLFDAFGLDVWARLQEHVRAELRERDRELAAQDATIERLTVETAARPALEQELRGLAAAELLRDAELRHAETDLSKISERYQAAREQDARRQALLAEHVAAMSARAHLKTVNDRATIAAGEIVDARASLLSLPAAARGDELRARIDELEAAVAAHARAERDHDLAAYDLAGRTADVERLRAHATELDVLADAVREKVRALDQHESPSCQTCGQLLPDEAKARAIASYEAELVRYVDAAAYDRDTAASITMPTVPAAPEGDAPEGELATVRGQLRTIDDAIAQRARLEERIAGLQRDVDARPAPLELEVAAQLVAAKQAALDDLEPVDLPAIEAEGVQARQLVAERRARTVEIREAFAATRARLERVTAAEAELAPLHAAANWTRARIDALKDAEKAYGPAGIPALILENAAIPMIETRANDILRRLDWTYRLRLETQRELKSSSGVREVLDIMVEVGDGDQLFEQCSGGEQMAINLALRLAIAELIATRFGVEVRLLALDEPEFMDAGRLDLFIALLADLEQQAAFEKVILVSHNLELRHAFEMVIEIAGGGDSGTPSMVTGAREQVPA